MRRDVLDAARRLFDAADAAVTSAPDTPSTPARRIDRRRVMTDDKIAQARRLHRFER